MTKSLALSLLIVRGAFAQSPHSVDLVAARALVARVVPGSASRFEVAAIPDSAGLDAFEVENDIQHAPRTLPWLDSGKNTITAAADRDPSIASRTVNFRITPDPAISTYMVGHSIWEVLRRMETGNERVRVP